MKFINKIKYTLLLLFGFFQMVSAQVVFHEDFGYSTVRLPSVFVPQFGRDSSLGGEDFTHGSKFYKLAGIAPDYSGENGRINVIDNGYYAIISPKYVYKDLPSNKPDWANWWQNVTNYTDNSETGAVLVVNGGSILNQFYRRAVSLEAGKTYRVSAYVFANVQSNVKIKFEAQNISSEQVLGLSEGISTPRANEWFLATWDFKIPANASCTDIAIALRNDLNSNGGNDFYIDDIKLEKIEDKEIVPILCSGTSINSVILANDNTINYTNKRSTLISDDSINGTIGGLLLSGANKNAVITKTGNWPLGYSIDNETGDLVIANNANRIAGPLQYTICNLLGVCSTANITFDNGSVSTSESSIFTLTSEVTESCFTGGSGNQKVRYTLKNISGRRITLDGESEPSWGGKKIKFNGSNINVNSMEVISGNMSLTGLVGYVKAKTFEINEVVVFEMEFNPLILSEEIVADLELRYGNSSASGPMNNPDFKLQVSNTIYKTPNPPSNKAIILNPVSTYTIYQASGLSEASSNFRFYNSNNQEIPFNTPIDMSFEGTLEYSYTKVSAAGCETAKAYLTFSKTAIELPNPGEISLSSVTNQPISDETTLCQIVDQFDEENNEVIQNSVTIYNKADGQGTLITNPGLPYALKYSWEVSYDNGVTWYVFEDSDGNAEGETNNGSKEITLKNVKKDVWIRRKAQERPESSRPNRFAFSNIVKLKVQKNEINIHGGNFHSRALTFLEADEQDGTLILNEELNKFIFPQITTTVPSTVEIIDETGRVYNPGDTFNFRTEGTYTFTVKAKSIEGVGILGNCETLATISLTVYDLNKCKVVVDKVIATATPPGGGWGTTLAGLVANSEKAYDNDMSTHSTISIVVGALGLGTTWQNLYFDHVVEAGTPLKVKLGQEYSAVQVAGGLTIVGLDENNNAIGPIKSVGEGALLDALTGDNVFEYTFVPTDGNGVAKPYKGVRVILGSLLALGNNAVLYGAYYEKERILQENEPTVQQPIYIKGAKLPVSNTQVNQLRYLMPETPENVVVLKPENEDLGIKLNEYVSDVSWGNQDAGLGVATALSSVVYPYLAVDDDPLTYTIFNKTVGALNVQSLDVRLRRTARPGDEIEVIMTNEGTNLLSLDLGADFTVQRFMDDEPVGPEIASNQFKVINLNLFLFKEPVPRFRVVGINQPFNRVVFRYFSAVQANLGNQMYLHDVTIVPQTVFDGNLNVEDNVELCAADFLKFKKPSACTEYKVNFVLGKEIQKEITKPDGTTTTIRGYDELEEQVLSDNLLKRVYENNTEAYYEIKRLYDLAPDQILLLKVQTIQNGEDFGGPQYIRVTLKNCLESIVNPVINLETKELN